MTILFVSHLSTNVAAGLNWSVPMSVKAQQKYDDVLWINTTNVVMPHWLEVNAFHNLDEFGDYLSIKKLPQAYVNPDLVVFEGLYFKEYVSFAKELEKKAIPYVIVPRSSLTRQALHNHARIKKWIAHKLFLNRFINNAWRIQYLTQKEADDSVSNFKVPYFILPNGTNTPEKIKESYSKGKIHAVFIGRLELYQKGLDLLLDAINICKDRLRVAGFVLSIYGPHRYDYLTIKRYVIEKRIDDIVHVYDEISGEDKQNVLLQSDLFVLTSRFEGHPMGLLEALSYGLPCLVTEGSNMLEEVNKSNAGWICEGTTEGIKNTLLDIISENSCLSYKGQNALELSKKYNWDSIAFHFHDEIKSIN